MSKPTAKTITIATKVGIDAPAGSGRVQSQMIRGTLVG